MALGIKAGGRQRGTPNKIAQQSREKLQDFYEEELESGSFQRTIRMLSPDKYVAAMLKLTPYLVVKVSKLSPAEEKAEDDRLKQPWIWTPVGTDEEVALRRAADPEEAELAKLLYDKKEQPAETEAQTGQSSTRLNNLFLPLATREEADRFGKITDLPTYASVIRYNDKNWEKWKWEEGEKVRAASV